MHADDAEQFRAAMVGLAENYGQTITPEGIMLRFNALRAYPVEDVMQATMSLLASRKYTTMPTVADFVEHLGGGAVQDIAEVEAGKVADAVRMIGGYRSVAFDDAVTQAVIEQGFGGWAKLNEELTDEGMVWFRKDFARMYQSYAKQGVKLHGHLAGIAEIQNCAKGLTQWIQPPALVGDRQKALAIAAIPSKRAITMRDDGEAVGVRDVVARAIPAMTA